jgi:hypothetical protein
MWRGGGSRPTTNAHSFLTQRALDAPHCRHTHPRRRLAIDCAAPSSSSGRAHFTGRAGQRRCWGHRAGQRRAAGVGHRDNSRHVTTSLPPFNPLPPFRANSLVMKTNVAPPFLPPAFLPLAICRLSDALQLVVFASSTERPWICVPSHAHSRSHAEFIHQKEREGAFCVVVRCA